MSGSYLYGESTAIIDGTSAQAASNWGNVYISGNPNDPPHVRSNFDPGHRITFSGGYDIPCRRLQAHGLGVLQRSVGPSLVGELRQRLQRRRAHDQRPALHPGERDRADHLHQRHLRGPDDVRQRRAVPRGLYRADRTAQRVPRAVDQHASTCGSTSACRSSACKTEITWDLLNLINLFDRQAGLLEYANFNDLLVVRPTISSTGATTYNLANLFPNGVLQTPQDSSRGTTSGRAGRCSSGRGFGSESYPGGFAPTAAGCTLSSRAASSARSVRVTRLADRSCRSLRCLELAPGRLASARSASAR